MGALRRSNTRRTRINFPWTRPGSCFSLTRMAQPEQKHTTPASIAIDALLVIGFFLFLYSVVKSHVPSTNPSMIMLWSGLTAACMSGVFWLVIQMFRVVLKAQLEARKK